MPAYLDLSASFSILTYQFDSRSAAAVQLISLPVSQSHYVDTRATVKSELDKNKLNARQIHILSGSAGPNRASSQERGFLPLYNAAKIRHNVKLYIPELAVVCKLFFYLLSLSAGSTGNLSCW